MTYPIFIYLFKQANNYSIYNNYGLWTLPQLDSSQTGLFPNGKFPMDSSPTGLFPNQTFPQLDTSPTRHFPTNNIHDRATPQVFSFGSLDKNAVENSISSTGKWLHKIKWLFRWVVRCLQDNSVKIKISLASPARNNCKRG